jgi:hypothetical protein
MTNPPHKTRAQKKADKRERKKHAIIHHVPKSPSEEKAGTSTHPAKKDHDFQTQTDLHLKKVLAEFPGRHRKFSSDDAKLEWIEEHTK